MLQSYMYRIPLGDMVFDTVAQSIRALAARLVRIEPRLRGLRVESDDAYLHITIRVAGNTRWDVSHHAKALIVKLTRAARIRTNTVQLRQVITEVNGRQLYLGEGRTEMARRPRAERKQDGTPWDDYKWWGDDLVGVTEDGHDDGSG